MSPFGSIGEALDLEEVHGERFVALADALARLSEQAGARVGLSESVWRDAYGRVRASGSDWTGPYGDGFRAAFDDVHNVLAPGAETTWTRAAAAFTALGDLAVTARRVGRAIDEAQQDHRNRVQAALGVGDEWIQRAWTNVQDVVGAESDAEADETRRRMDEANHAREVAEERVRAQLQIWRQACEGAASAVQFAAEELERSLPGVVPAPAPGSSPGSPSKEQLRQQWITDSVEPWVVRHRGDAGALAALWARLSPQERRVLMDRAPDLVQRDLLPFLSDGERRTFAGLRDAAETRDAVRAVGLDPDHFAPLQLVDVDHTSPAYRALVDLLDRKTRELVDDPVRAAAYLDAVGVEGVRTQLAVLEHAVDRSGGDPRAEAVVKQYAAMFARTTGAPELAGLRSALLAPETPWQLHQLGLLLAADGQLYDPAFLVRSLDSIDANSGRLLEAYRNQPPVVGTAEWASWQAAMAYPSNLRYADGDLLMPEVTALRALSGNREASWQVVHDGTGVRRAQLDRLLRENGDRLAPLYAARVGDGSPRWDLMTPADRDRMSTLGTHAETYAAGILDNALLVHAADDHAASFALFVEAVRSTAAGGTSGSAKRVMATRLANYLDDLSAGAWVQTPTRDIRREVRDAAESANPTRPELLRFFAELGADKDAAGLVGSSMTLWAAGHVAPAYEGIGMPNREWRTRVQEASLMAGAARNGFEMARERNLQAAEDFARGVTSAGVLMGTVVLEGVTGGGFGAPPVSAFNYWAATEAANLLGDEVRRRAVERANDQSQNEWAVNDSVMDAIAQQVPDKSGEALAGWNDPGIGDRDEMPANMHWNNHSRTGAR